VRERPTIFDGHQLRVAGFDAGHALGALAALDP